MIDHRWRLYLDTYRQKMADFAETELGKLPLSTRVKHCLINADLRTFEQIRDLGGDGLLRIENFGRKSLKELEEAIAKAREP